MLYRQRLQVERDLRAGAMAGDAVVGADTPGVGHEGVLGALEDLGRVVRAGAEAVLEAAADERDRPRRSISMAGPEWRWAARAASVAATAAQEVIRAREEGDEAPDGVGEAPPPRTAEALERDRPSRTRRRPLRSPRPPRRAPARQARGRGHPFRGFTPGRARVHERLHLRERRRERRPGPAASASGDVPGPSAFPPIPTTSTNSPRAGIAPSADGRRQLAERAAHDLLVQLGELPAHRPGPPRATGRGQIPERGRDPPGRLEQHGSPVVGRDRRQPVLAVPPGARQEPLERPARPRHPGRGDGREHGRCARGSARPGRPPPPTPRRGPRRDR